MDICWLRWLGARLQQQLLTKLQNILSPPPLPSLSLLRRIQSHTFQTKFGPKCMWAQISLGAAGLIYRGLNALFSFMEKWL